MKKYAILLGALLLGVISLSSAQAPVPFISLPLVPDATAPGGGDFTLTINGTGFVSGSVVNWNGNALATQFVSGSQLTATVPGADTATASTAWVTVINPASHGGTSNVAFFAVAANEGDSVVFSPASSPAAGGGPYSMAEGDFNGDGKPDLAVANGDGGVSILLGDGTGNFTLASSPGAGDYPISVAVGDFNGDGKLDLAVGNERSDTVSILLGDGTGNFTLVSSPATGDYPVSVAVGDFNGDGKLDLAVANLNNSNLSILLGDGMGDFTLASSPATGTLPGSVAIGDFNGDGELDLAVGDLLTNTVSVLLGDGTGNFILASSPGTGDTPASVAVGDFNGDGKLDLAVANFNDFHNHTVSILVGDGTGNFTLASTPGAGPYPCCVAVGDFNGDNKLDLAVTNSAYINTVSVLLGDGTGNFTLSSSLPTGIDPFSVVVGDFNGDGRLDLAVVNRCGNDPTCSGSTVSILLQGPAVALSPTSLNFGMQVFGTSSNPQPVTLTNTGNAPLNISKIVASPNFSQTNNCPRRTLPGGQCTANVVFTPRNLNAITGSITISDNAFNSPQTVSLTGVGTVATLLPSSLDFGSQAVGTKSQPQTVTLTNHAPRAISILGESVTGGSSQFALYGKTCGTRLPVGGSCTISIVFTPKFKGLRSATLEVDYNAGGSPQTVTLSGTGTQP